MRLPELLGVGGLAAEQVGSSPGRGCWCPGSCDGGDLELELVQALLVEREVDRGGSSADAQLFQVAHPGRPRCARRPPCCPGIRAPSPRPWHCARRRRGTSQPACLEQLAAPAQVVAQRAGPGRRCAAACTWGRTPRPASCRARAPARRQFLRRRRALGLAIGVAEQALHALVRVVEHLPVHPLVVERQAQRLAHARVLQLSGGCSARSSGSRPAACAGTRP
jgi:hypothetical protein